jgi:predicted nucleic acid-binding Zn ribbon protein
MPLYEYVCTDGHKSEILVRDVRNEPKFCECVLPIVNGVTRYCNKPLMRVISAPSGRFPGADSWRQR